MNDEDIKKAREVAENTMNAFRNRKGIFNDEEKRNPPEIRELIDIKDQEDRAKIVTLAMSIDYRKETETKNGRPGLWKQCVSLFKDQKTKWFFDFAKVIQTDFIQFQNELYNNLKIARFPDPAIWYNVCNMFKDRGVIGFFEEHDKDAVKVESILKTNKKKYPFLSGEKISKVWLRMMSDIKDTGVVGLPLIDIKEIDFPVDIHTRKISNLLIYGNEKELKDRAVQKLWRESYKIPLELDVPLWTIHKHCCSKKICETPNKEDCPLLGLCKYYKLNNN